MENEKKKSSGNKLFLILTIILVILSGVLGWQLYEQKTAKEEVIAEKNTLTEEKASLNSELDDLLSEYEAMEAANGELSEELKAEKAKIEELKVQLGEAKADVEKMKRYRNEVWSLKKKFKELEVVNDSLLQVNEALKGENEEVKKDLTQQQEMNQELTNENMGLANQVAVGSILKAYEVSAVGVRERWGKEKETDRARRVDKIKICFTLSENKITKSGTKNIYVQIEDPMGKILAEGMGESNVFQLNGEEIGFTEKKEIIYENEAMPMCFYYNKSEDFAEGEYRVKVYEDRALIGQASMKFR